MQPDRAAFLAYLAPRLPTDAQACLAGLAIYLEQVQQYSRVVNLTGLKGVVGLSEGLVLESLRLLDLGPISGELHVCDLGSGNGSPVIPLALCAPEGRFTAVESRSRRSAFLRQLKAMLRLDNLEVLELRAEELIAERSGCYDLVVGRAFARPQQFLATGLRLLCPGGELRGFCGADIEEVERAATELGLATVRSIAYDSGEMLRHVYSVRDVTSG